MLACIESMFGEQVFSHYNYFTLVPSKFSHQNESSTPPEMIDRNVIYIQVPGATQPPGQTASSSIVNSLLFARWSVIKEWSVL